MSGALPKTATHIPNSKSPEQILSAILQSKPSKFVKIKKNHNGNSQAGDIINEIPIKDGRTIKEQNEETDDDTVTVKEQRQEV